MSDQKGDALLRRLGREARRRDEVKTDPAAAMADQPGDSDRWPTQSSDSRSEDWVREAQTPLDDEAKSRIVDHLSALLADEENPSTADEPAEPAEPASENPPKAPLSARPPRARGRPPAWIAVPIAATLLVVLGIAFLQPGGPVGPAGTLPEYRLAIEGAVQTERGPSSSDSGFDSGSDPLGAPVRLAPGNRLQVVMAPAEPTEDLATVGVYLDRGEGWRELSATLLERSQQGAVRLDAVVGDELDLLPGRQRLLVVVSASSELPQPEVAAIAASATGDAQDTWRAQIVSLDVLEPAYDAN